MPDEHEKNEAADTPKEEQRGLKSVLDASDTPAGADPVPFPSYHHGHGMAHPSKIKLRFLGAALLIIISASAGFAGGWLGNRDDNNTTIQKQEVVLKNQGQLISTIANNVSPSVVSVEASATAQVDTGLGGLFGLGDQTQSQQEVSEGTGIIINKDGLILTNRHVIPDGTTSVSVTLSDGTTYNNVQVVGRTSDSDSLDIRSEEHTSELQSP